MKFLRDSSVSLRSSNPDRKRKRNHESSQNWVGEVDHYLSQHKDEPDRKRRRTAKDGIYMGKAELPTTSTCKAICHTMLDTEQSIPKDSIFRDDLFETTCENIRNRNEARVIQDRLPDPEVFLPSPNSQTLSPSNKTTASRPLPPHRRLSRDPLTLRHLSLYSRS